MELETIEITVRRECSSKPEVTYGVRLEVMEDWKALVRYRNHMLMNS